MSWFLSKVYTTLRGASSSSSRSSNSSVATTRSFSDAETDSLDLNCTVSPGNNHRYSYLSYGSVDKEGSSCDGWSRPESTTGSIHDGEFPEGLIIKLYGEDYIFCDGEYRPLHREPESKRFSTISISCSNQNNENEKMETPENTDPQFEWSDEKEDWITPLGFGSRLRQSKRRSMRPRSENVDEMWLRVMKSVNASFEYDDEDGFIEIGNSQTSQQVTASQIISDMINEDLNERVNFDDSDNTEINNSKTSKQVTASQIVSDIINEDRSTDGKCKKKLKERVKNIEERQAEQSEIINVKINIKNDNLNENDFIKENNSLTSYIEVDSLPDFGINLISRKGESKENEDFFTDDNQKIEGDDEFRSSLAGASDILNEIFEHFGLPTEAENDENEEITDESTAFKNEVHDVYAAEPEIVTSRVNDNFEQPITFPFKRSGSYASLKDILPEEDIGLFDELECIFTDRQSSLFNDEESSKANDEISALRKSIENIVSELDKRTNTELQLKRLRQSLKKLNNFGTKSLNNNKHITNDSPSVTMSTDTGEQPEHMHNVFSQLVDTQNHYSHETHSSGKNSSTYSDNKGNEDYSFNLNSLDYDRPIEHDSIAYAVTNNIFSAESGVLGKKQIEQANTRSTPFAESINFVHCSTDGQQSTRQQSNALVKTRRKLPSTNNTEAEFHEPESESFVPTDYLSREFDDKELFGKDDPNIDKWQDSNRITWAGNRASDKLTMVKVQSELTPGKIDRRYRKAFRSVKPDQAASSERDIVEANIKNSEYLLSEPGALLNRNVESKFSPQFNFNELDNDGLTNSDINMGCISVYCKSKTHDNEQSDNDDDYYNNSSNNQLVNDEQNGKYGFENMVLDKDITDGSSHGDALGYGIVHEDSKIQMSLKNDRNKNGINYIFPEIQSVSQIESYKLGTDLTNDSAFSGDLFDTEQADKDDLDSGLECQDDAREEDRVQLSLKLSNEGSLTTEQEYKSHITSGENNSISNFHALLTDRHEYSSEEIGDFLAIKPKEILNDDHDKISTDLDSDSFWQEPFEFCSENSPLSSPCLDDHGRFAQTTTEILELKLSTLLNDSDAVDLNIFKNKGDEMGNSATYEHRSNGDEDDDHYGKDEKQGFWDVTRRSGAFGSKRVSNRTSQFYVALDPNCEDIIVPQTIGFVHLTPVGASSTDNPSEETIIEASLDGQQEQDDNQSDCTSVSLSSSLGITSIFNERPQKIDNRDCVDTLNFDNNHVISDDVNSLTSGSLEGLSSQEYMTVIKERSPVISLSAINQSINRSCTKIKHWKSVDGLIHRLHEDAEKRAESDDKLYDHQIIGLSCNMNEYESDPVIHDKLNNNCNKIEDSLTLQSSEVSKEKKIRVDDAIVNANDMENSNSVKHVDIQIMEEEWQRNRLLRQKKRDELKKREQELQAKVDWVRDEIKVMKQLDKKLMDQFFELRSVIHKMTFSPNRPTRDLNISDLDEEDAFYEDAEIIEFNQQSIPSHEHYIPAFRGRTVSMMTPPSERRMKLQHNRRMPSFTTEDDVPIDMLL